jgi:very-short-patch-repair endonuclease
VDVIAAVETAGRSSQGLAIAKQLRAAGLAPAAVARAVAAGDVVRVHRRVYALAPLPVSPLHLVTDKGVAPAYVAHVRAAILSLGPGAMAHQRTAAALRGWGLLIEPSRSIELAVPHGSRRASVRQVKLTERRGLAVDAVTPIADADGVASTTAVQTVIDCAVSLPLIEAVVVCDSALRAGDVTLHELSAAAASLRGVRDARRCRQVIDHADPACGSVLESVLRVRMVMAGISGFTSQQVIVDPVTGRERRVDFAFEAAHLVIETDGEKWHPDPSRDRERDNALAELGWRVLRYSWAEVVRTPLPALRQIAAAAGLRISDGQLLGASLAQAA